MRSLQLHRPVLCSLSVSICSAYMAYITSQGHKRPRRPSHALPGEVRVQKKKRPLTLSCQHYWDTVAFISSVFLWTVWNLFFSILFLVSPPLLCSSSYKCLTGFLLSDVHFTFYVLCPCCTVSQSHLCFSFDCLCCLSVSFSSTCLPSFFHLLSFLSIIYSIIPHTYLCCFYVVT